MSHPGNEAREELGEDEEPTELTTLDDSLVPTESVKLGRYELVLELGTGGMASVHLARTRGPAGFHKWFAVKRIHPHLAKDERFVDMFLDEARIAASIEHPNVAQVVELGEGEGSYFIAMEYLHGEHLGRVASRALRESGHVPYHGAARMIAAAANGLHAAHEGRDPEGRPLDLVHRDVSPQNIFVTYDGRVKLTDFGVAKAANRISHTTTGTAKGKVAYMAPEQALGGEVDRRTDIFALGAVLWEITTGRRLFKAGTDAQTLMRITGGKVPKPTSMRHDYPKALERIALKALARRPEDRFPSAAAMAQELERFAATSPEPVTQRVVADMMGRLFADSKPGRDQMLRVTAGKPTLSPSEALSVDDLPAMSSEPRTLPSSSVVRPVRKARSRRIIGAALGFLAAGVLGAVIALLFARAEPEPTESAASAATAVEGPSNAPVPDTPAANVEPVVTSAQPEALSSEEPAADPAALAIASTPSGAAVEIDGMEAGTTPLRVSDVGEGSHRLTFRRRGYRDAETVVEAVAGETREIRQRLAPIPAPEPAPVAAASPPEPAASPAAPPPEPAMLRVTAMPWAEVTVGGRTENTPHEFRVRPGPVRVRYRFRGEGPRRTKTVDIAPGAREAIFLTDR